MLLLAPFRLLRLLTIPPRVAAHTLFHPRFGSLKLAIVFFGIAGMIACLNKSRRTSSGA